MQSELPDAPLRRDAMHLETVQLEIANKGEQLAFGGVAEELAHEHEARGQSGACVGVLPRFHTFTLLESRR